jgi:hypothetical protein
MTTVIVLACLAVPALIYTAGQLLFAWDDRHWRRAWRAYRAAGIPRPAVLGNVVPPGTADAHSAHVAEIAGEVVSDE